MIQQKITITRLAESLVTFFSPVLYLKLYLNLKGQTFTFLKARHLKQKKRYIYIPYWLLKVTHIYFRYIIKAFRYISVDCTLGDINGFCTVLICLTVCAILLAASHLEMITS